VDDEWDRRRFLKRLGITGGAAAVASGIGLIAHEDPNSPQKQGAPQNSPRRAWDYRMNVPDGPVPIIVSKGDPATATRAGVEALGGMKHFIQSKDCVVIKPNIGWDRTPIQAANTNPMVVATLVKLCLEGGASKVIVTDNSCNEASRCFTRSGIWKAVEEAGGELVLPDDHRFTEVDLGGVLGRIPVLNVVMEADRLINAPIAKHHSLSGFTGAMKNLYGVLGGRRNRLHQSIHESIADLAQCFRATLTVMDATRVLFRNGPQGGSIDDTREINEVILSENPVAVDAYSCTLIEQKPENLPYLHLAAARGIGSFDTDYLNRMMRRIS
jgi:uncharacterized protein (DUF362 family)